MKLNAKTFFNSIASLHNLCEKRLNAKCTKDSQKTQRKSYLRGLFHFTFFLLFIGASVNAQSGNETLKKIQNRFKTLTDFSADFTQTIFGSEGKGGTKLSGKFFYKRKNKFVVELKNGSIISNGETVWNYDTKQKRVVISPFSDDPTSFSLERYVFDYPSVCKVKSVANENGKDEIIELVPKDNNIDFKSAKIWKNSDDMISRMDIVDLADTKYTFQLSAIKIDQGVQDSKFNFNPPKGIKIIDLR